MFSLIPNLFLQMIRYQSVSVVFTSFHFHPFYGAIFLLSTYKVVVVICCAKQLVFIQAPNDGIFKISFTFVNRKDHFFMYSLNIKGYTNNISICCMPRTNVVNFLCSFHNCILQLLFSKVNHNNNVRRLDQ